MTHALTTLDPDACHRAMLARDPRFDGRFFHAVRTTGIYCRPVCPTPPPERENCTWYPSAAAAQAAGYRPCLRCRPELAPGPGWDGTDGHVRRALELIGDGLAAELGVPALAARVGVHERALRRQFARHVGASPKQVATAQRTLFAKALAADSGLSMAEVAFAAGFGSVRRFNAAFRAMFGRLPGALRRDGGAAAAAGHEAGAVLRLPYREPFPWESVLAFLAARAIPGVEAVGGGTYRRTVRVGPATGTVEVERPPGTGWLLARVVLSDLGQLAALRGRLRRLFDLDADPAAIDPMLARDPLLAADVAARPGQRVPGAWDGIEIGVRAILGQQISVAGARTLAGRIAARWGEPAGDGGLARLFPTAAALAEADLAAVGVIPARARAVRALARALAAEPDLLAPHRPHGETVRRLEALPGIGPWTAQYIALRALRDPDAFPAADLGLLRAAAGAPGRPLTPRRLLERAEAWRPWRAYAAARLWTMATPAKAKEIELRRPEPEPATAAVGA